MSYLRIHSKIYDSEAAKLEAQWPESMARLVLVSEVNMHQSCGVLRPLKCFVRYLMDLFTDCYGTI